MHNLSYPCFSRPLTSKIPMYPVMPGVWFGIFGVGLGVGVQLSVHKQQDQEVPDPSERSIIKMFPVQPMSSEELVVVLPKKHLAIFTRYKQSQYP